MNDRVRILLQSLLNATLLLAVILTLAVWGLICKVEGIANGLLAQATTSVLREARHDVDDVIASIAAVDEDLKQLISQISKVVEEPVELLSERDIQILNSVRSQVVKTNRLIARISDPYGSLSDRTIERAAAIAADTIISIRNCRPLNDA